MKANLIAQKYNFPSVDILQPMYNIVKRQAEVEILPMAKAEDIGVISYSPLGGGFLQASMMHQLHQIKILLEDCMRMKNIKLDMDKIGCTKQHIL